MGNCLINSSTAPKILLIGKTKFVIIMILYSYNTEPIKQWLWITIVCSVTYSTNYFLLKSVCICLRFAEVLFPRIRSDSGSARRSDLHKRSITEVGCILRYLYTIPAALDSFLHICCRVSSQIMYRINIIPNTFMLSTMATLFPRSERSDL